MEESKEDQGDERQGQVQKEKEGRGVHRYEREEEMQGRRLEKERLRLGNNRGCKGKEVAKDRRT